MKGQRRLFRISLMMLMFVSMMFFACRSNFEDGKYQTTLKRASEEIDVILVLNLSEDYNSGRLTITDDRKPPMNTDRLFLPDSVHLEKGETINFIIEPKISKDKLMTFYVTNDTETRKSDLAFILESKGNKLVGVWKLEDEATETETPVVFKKMKD